MGGVISGAVVGVTTEKSGERGEGRVGSSVRDERRVGSWSDVSVDICVGCRRREVARVATFAIMSSSSEAAVKIYKTSARGQYRR